MDDAAITQLVDDLFASAIPDKRPANRPATFPGPLGVPPVALERFKAGEPIAATVQSNEAIAARIAAVAVQDMMRAWPATASEAVASQLPRLCGFGRLHIAWSLRCSAKLSGRKKLDPAMRQQRRRQKQGVAHLRAFLEILEEDRRVGPWYSSLTAALRRPDLATAFSGLKVLVGAVDVGLTGREPKRKTGRPAHPTWDGLIREFAAAYIATTGGHPRDVSFRRGLHAFNKRMPASDCGRSTPQALDKRVKRLFPAARAGQNSSSKARRAS
jgi:hypothetical protein